MPAPQIYQILNHYTPREELDPGFEILDNSANERPDWFEYWPIRSFLLGQALDENTFYGFLSPKFKLKTSLSSQEVSEFILSADSSVDVVLLSPSIHNSAYYLNVFEHGDAEHPGLKDVAKTLFERLELPGDLDSLVSDSRNTVHSNYFIAKPRFWRAWLAINEKMYAIAETPGDALGQALCAPTTYRGGTHVQMKIFVMERIATWLLTSGRSFTAGAREPLVETAKQPLAANSNESFMAQVQGPFIAQVRDPFVARSRIYKLPVAILCDALKIAYATQGRSQYRDVFLLVRSLRKFWNFQIRLGGALGFRHIAPTLRVLKSYWLQDGR
jgi:hypothetical protein